MTKTAEPSPPPTESTAAVEAPPLAPGAVPLCYVVDEEPSLRHFVSLVLHGVGVDTVECADGDALRKALITRLPDLVFHNISLESTDAIDSMLVLGKRGFRGTVQLMSNRGAAVLDHVKTVGLQQKLNMLPVLKKPFETDAILKILHELKLGLPPAVATRLDLAEALDNKWIEFWYQPKIDLRKKRLVGAEAFARARHPQHGIVLPGAFLPGASEPSLLKLSELALISALQAGANFAKLGVHLMLSVNIPLAPLQNLPLEDLVKAHRPQGDKWPGLIVDVAEEEIVADLARAGDAAKRLEALGLKFAVEGFGRSQSVFAQIAELPFAEVKLTSTIVTDCATDKANAPLCKAAIDFAHNGGRAAVAMGVEKATDAVALVSMGCNFGQGFLLGQPMPEDRFTSLLRQRAAAPSRNAASADKQPA
jgi:EAL domain-containing protein (putative c-di-GMP-specific phosphodiesterase class I)/CheY-like chemotaxis protein